MLEPWKSSINKETTLIVIKLHGLRNYCSRSQPGGTCYEYEKALAAGWQQGLEKYSSEQSCLRRIYLWRLPIP